jgi:hypothetical protein
MQWVPEKGKWKRVIHRRNDETTAFLRTLFNIEKAEFEKEVFIYSLVVPLHPTYLAQIRVTEDAIYANKHCILNLLR